MRRFFARIGEAFRRFMAGRYGGDSLNGFLLLAATVLFVLGFAPVLWFFSIPAYALTLWALFRALSRNHYKRRAEEAKYLRLTGGIKKKWALCRKKWKERKTHRYYKCPHCHATLRVPKPKNRIVITCPRCRERVEKGPRKPRK
ncbi:MAG: hypothetical protein IJ012_04750 [Clostridia bacterium]|nr:hypothetical protein [Clostridia bacterium]